MRNVLSQLIFGMPAAGENIIKTQPILVTITPDEKLEISEWMTLLNVSAPDKVNKLVQKHVQNGSTLILNFI